MMLSLKGCFL